MPTLLSPLFYSLLQVVLTLNIWLNALFFKRRDNFDLERDGVPLSPFPMTDAYTDSEIIPLNPPSDAHITPGSPRLASSPAPVQLPTLQTPPRSRLSSSSASTASPIASPITPPPPVFCPPSPNVADTDDDDEVRLADVMARLKNLSPGDNSPPPAPIWLVAPAQHRTTPSPSTSPTSPTHVISNSLDSDSDSDLATTASSASVSDQSLHSTSSTSLSLFDGISTPPRPPPISALFDVQVVLNQLRERQHHARLASAATSRMWDHRSRCSSSMYSQESVRPSFSLGSIHPNLAAPAVPRSRSEGGLPLVFAAPGNEEEAEQDMKSPQTPTPSRRSSVSEQDPPPHTDAMSPTIEDGKRTDRRSCKSDLIVAQYTRFRTSIKKRAGSSLSQLQSSVSSSISKKNSISNSSKGSHKWTVDTSRTLRKAIYPSPSCQPVSPVLLSASMTSFKFPSSKSSTSSVNMRSSKDTSSFLSSRQSSSAPSLLKRMRSSELAKIFECRTPTTPGFDSSSRLPVLSENEIDLTGSPSTVDSSDDCSVAVDSSTLSSQEDEPPVEAQRSESAWIEPPGVNDESTASGDQHTIVNDSPSCSKASPGFSPDQPCADAQAISEPLNFRQLHHTQLDGPAVEQVAVPRCSSSHYLPLQCRRQQALSTIVELPSLVIDLDCPNLKLSAASSSSVCHEASEASGPETPFKNRSSSCLALPPSSPRTPGSPGSQLPYLFPSPSPSAASVTLVLKPKAPPSAAPVSMGMRQSQSDDTFSSSISYDRFIQRLEERYQGMEWDEMVEIGAEGQGNVQGGGRRCSARGKERAQETQGPTPASEEWCDVFNLGVYTRMSEVA